MLGAMDRPRSVALLRPRSPDGAVPHDPREPQLSDAKLQGFVDGALTVKERLEVEDVLAIRPDIQQRLDAYRSQIVALNAAFNAGEEPLPLELAALSLRLRRRLAACRVTMMLGFVATVAILLLSAELMFSAGP